MLLYLQDLVLDPDVNRGLCTETPPLLLFISWSSTCNMYTCLREVIYKKKNYYKYYIFFNIIIN